MAFRLYDYQEEMRRRLLDRFGAKSALMCQMPTGTGKTHLMASVAASVAKAGDEVWVVAHRRELVEQIRFTWENFYKGRKTAPTVTVLSIQWLSRHWDEMAARNPVMIVVDEAHHAVADTYRELFARYPAARKLGVTATPYRMDGEGFTELFDELLCSMSLPQFIAAGRLSLFEYYCVPENSKVRRLLAGITKRGADGDYPAKELDHALNNDRNIAHLYNSLRKYAPRRKGIVYAVGIDHARRIARYYASEGLRCCAIDSRTPAKERNGNVEAFRRGEIDVMVNVDIFSEGFDCPDVEFIQLARPTLSLAVYLQQIGRGLRKAKGKRHCVILDCVGLSRTFGLPIREWDWQAAFDGTTSDWRLDKNDRRRLLKYLGYRGKMEDEPLELVIDRRSIMDNITEEAKFSAYSDPFTGLVGLKTADGLSVPLEFKNIIGLQGPFAIVETRDGTIAAIHSDGFIQRLDYASNVGLLPNRILKMTVDAKPVYKDAYGVARFEVFPVAVRVGKVELLKVGDFYAPRTKLDFRFRIRSALADRCWKGYYLEIPDVDGELRLHYECGGIRIANINIRGGIVLLPDDHETIYRKVADEAGGIMISDLRTNYYRLTPDGTKRRIVPSGIDDTGLRPSGFGSVGDFYSEMEALNGSPSVTEWRPLG